MNTNPDEFEKKILADLKECYEANAYMITKGGKNGDYYAGKREVLEWLANEIELELPPKYKLSVTLQTQTMQDLSRFHGLEWFNTDTKIDTI